MNRLILFSKPARLLLAVATLFATASCFSPGSEESEAGEGSGPEPLDRVSLSADALESIELTYASAVLMELAATLEVPAEVIPVPDRLAAIGARVSGRIVNVFVNTGDQVGRSDPLLVIESGEVGRAWADLISSRAREHVALRARDRQRELLDGGVTSVRAFEEAQGAWEVAEAEVRASLTRLAALGVAEPGDPPANPARVTLFSPIAGSVTVRNASLGAWVEPSDILMQVIDLDEVWLEAAVYEREMRYVSVGLSVDAEVRAFPDDVFQGTVERLAGVLDEQTRSIGVVISLPNEGGRLRPGMFATARIHAHSTESRESLVIPWVAVQDVDGDPTVFVRAGEGVFEIRRVHTAARVGDFVEVLTGLAVGEEVVADGSFILKGQMLRSELAEEDEG